MIDAILGVLARLAKLGRHQHGPNCVPSPGLIHGPATVYRFGKPPVAVPRGYTYFPDCHFEQVADPEDEGR